jgi:hypothetical protein
MIDPQHKLAACGDWLDKGRVEAAFSAGYTLAHQIKSSIECTKNAKYNNMNIEKTIT